MKIDVPRLRMFASPNGSGKSSVKEIINDLPAWFTEFVVDEINTD